jgi:hypothetical protein
LVLYPLSGVTIYDDQREIEFESLPDGDGDERPPTTDDSDIGPVGVQLDSSVEHIQAESIPTNYTAPSALNGTQLADDSYGMEEAMPPNLSFDPSRNPLMNAAD